ncbi:MAG: EF-Tu/IF-2/RF-3 family GTPase [Methanomassiliicoccales archaeon]
MNLALVGGPQGRLIEIAGAIGKKGTESDLIIFDRKTDEKCLSIVIPKSYPERMQPLLQSLNMADAVIFVPETVDSIAGEIIVATGCVGRGGTLLSDADTAARLLPLLRASGNEWAHMETGDDTTRELREKLWNMKIQRRENEEHWRVDVDHSFEVRGVGTVVLGVVKYGRVKVHDRLLNVQAGKEGMIRSIQIFDEDVPEASAGSRVGLALKGLTVEQLPRGTVLTNDMHFEASNEITIEFKKEKYFKDALQPGKAIHLSAGLQCKEAKIISSDGNMELETAEPVAFGDEMGVLFQARPPSGLRIAGSGRMGKLLK